MLRHPVTFIVVMCGLALVAVYNFVFFTTRPETVPGGGESPAAKGDVAAAPTDLNALLDQLKALQKTRPQEKPLAGGGHEINAFLYPVEREKGVPLNDVLEARAAARALQEAQDASASPLVPAVPASIDAALAALELRAVIHGADTAVAVLGRTVVHEGDTLLAGAAVVLKIEADRVQLQAGERTVWKLLKPFEPVLSEPQTAGAPAGDGVGRAETPRHVGRDPLPLPGKSGDAGTSVDSTGASGGKNSTKSLGGHP